MEEYWTNIKGNNNYCISTFGNVENMVTGRILKACIDSHGYYIVNLYKNGKVKTQRVHQLVAKAFLDNFDDKLCVDHIDNDHQNNNINNLRFATHTENNRNRKMSKNNTSGIKGVHFNSNRNKWQAYIKIDGIKIHLGSYDNIEDAKQARVNKANEVFGEFINDCEN